MKNKSSTMKRVLLQIKPYLPTIILLLIFAVISVICTLYIPVLIGDAIDCIISAGQVDFDAIMPKLYTCIGLILVVALSQWLMNVCGNRVTYNTIRDMRELAFKKIHRLPFSYLDSHETGDIVSRIIADVDQFADGLLMGFSQLFTGIVTIIGTIGFMLSVNVWITCVVILITPLSIVVARFIAKKTYTMFKLQSETRGKQTAFINEMITNQKVVRAYGHEDENIEHFDEINKELQKHTLKATFFSSITNPATRFVNSVVYAAVALIGALLAISGGGFTVGMLSAFLSYANQYTKPFNEISGVITELQNALACAERLLQFIDTEELSEEPEMLPEFDKTPIGNISFKDVHFSYTKDKPLIEGFSLEVPAGKKVAIVGPTGCGKTTMINLLMRFYDPDTGSISVDGIDTKTMPRKELRHNFGMVLQETWLKSGTITDNIRMGRPDASEEEVIAAAKAAHADSFIRQLPNGYNTMIGEDGGSLSAGQKQLLCISRIMLTLPPMLILDEATSSIDTRTELRIQRAFAKLTKGRTSFVVAHRLSTIKESDIILVMKDGNIIEQGNHDSLLAQNGFYAELYRSQFTEEEIANA
jgi:ATP-binding cassette, subfamily B, multidrug efflux pump